jgi:hypothetical protein
MGTLTAPDTDGQSRREPWQDFELGPRGATAKRQSHDRPARFRTYTAPNALTACFRITARREAEGSRRPALAYVYFEDEPWPANGDETDDAQRGAADRGENRDAAGPATRSPKRG